jgi:uncharacterized membrane protein YccC
MGRVGAAVAFRYRIQLALCSRITIAAVATLAIGRLIGTPMVLWAVLTAVLLTQMSVGRSIKATIDYLLGTLGGAIYSGVVAILVPATTDAERIGVLTLAIAPLALLAAISPRFTVAPSTGVLVVLAPTLTHVTPFVSAYDRVLEVALGGAVALVVSHFVFPARARMLVREAAADMLVIMAEALPHLFSGFAENRDAETIRSLQRGVGAAFERLDKMEQEARHERIAFLSAAEPDLAPLLRALLRMRHDLVMIGRAAATPLPTELRDRLQPTLADIARCAADYSRRCADALTRSRAPGPCEALEAAFDAYAREVAALRENGALRDLPFDRVEHLFALGFALEQWRGDFAELARGIAEHALRKR